MIWNGLSLIVTLVVGFTFLWGSRQPATADIQPSDITLFFFTLFDILLLISPVMLVVMVILSIFNLMRENTTARRFGPLVFSTILQGLLSAFLLTSLTRPVG